MRPTSIGIKFFNACYSKFLFLMVFQHCVTEYMTGIALSRQKCLWVSPKYHLVGSLMSVVAGIKGIGQPKCYNCLAIERHYIVACHNLIITIKSFCPFLYAVNVY